MSVSLANRVALVTGGAHRVGKAIVMALAKEQMRIALHYGGSAKEANATADEVRAAGVAVQLFQADLRDVNAATQLIADVVTAFGGLDLLVNSAAVMRHTPVGQVTQSVWDEMFALNTRAPFFMSQAAAPHLAKTQGSIVNIADLAAFEAWPEYVPHAMTKASIVQMTHGLAHALAPAVRVNAIAPGAVLLPGEWSKADADHFAESTPLKRLGSPDDVARTVVFLAQSDYVTGDTIIVDGGRHVRK